MDFDHIQLAETADGSMTFFNSRVGEHYHSRHGAVQESLHVFVKSGMQFQVERQDLGTIKILEVGFGTGLNFLLSAEWAVKKGVELVYTGIEAYPLSQKLISETCYQNYVDANLWSNFITHYPESFEQLQQINPGVNLHVDHTELLSFKSESLFDLIYFDAFAAIHQAEMWNLESLKHITHYLKPDGVFVTYAITGELKRNMKSLGFAIEKAPGAPGKREMLRAIKLY